MQLTPIRIKGKRGNPPKPKWRPPDSSLIAKRRREAIEVGDEAGTSSNRDASGHSKRQRATKPPATIETFPPEILERITVMSENVNFVRSSLRISRLLTHRSFYLQLLLNCFRPTWNQWFRVAKEVASTITDDDLIIEEIDKSTSLKEKPHGRAIFQSEVLACPWMSIDLALETVEMWYREESKVNPEEEFVSLRHAADFFNDEWRSFMQDHGGRRSTRPTTKRPGRWLPTPKVHPRAKIPDWLLSGSPTWDKTKLLFWLIRSGSRIHPNQTYELTRDGYEQIMMKGRSGDENDRFLASAMLDLFNSLNVFQGQWPVFLKASKKSESMGRQGIDAYAFKILGG